GTLIFTSELEVSSESLAVRRSTYAPVASNDAVVTGAFGFANVTMPGPLTLVQTLVRLPPTGSPSSDTEPDRLIVDGTEGRTPTASTLSMPGTAKLPICWPVSSAKVYTWLS